MRYMNKIIMIYGPAGVGKTTQAQILADKLGRKWLSAGQIIRDSQLFNNFTSKGAMIEEKTLVELLKNAFNDASKAGKDVVFDGQPGTPEQVEMLKNAGILDRVEYVILLKAPEEELIKRLSSRGREDDNVDVWKTKIKYFEQKSYSFLTEMKRQNVKVFEIDGCGTIEQVADKINNIKIN